MRRNFETLMHSLVAAFEKPVWLAVSALVYAGMAAVMATGFWADPRQSFFLIMGAIFAGWAIENAIKLQFPGGNLIGAALTPMVVVAMACTYLYGRDGHWLYGVIMMLGLCGFIGSSIAMAAYGTPMAKPEPTPKSDQANAC